MDMEKISIDQVVRTYNGKEGCACGCLGRYSLKRAEDITAANAASGWEANDVSDVRPRAVASAVRTCNDAIDEFGGLAKDNGNGALEYYDRSRGIWFCRHPEFVSITRNGRNSTAYFVF
jgi:hypothetical protein